MDLFKRLDNLYYNYPFEKGVIGWSLNNAPLYYFAVRKSLTPKIICQYSIHAREYINSYLAIKQMEYFIKYGNKGCVYFIPLVNPDGVKRVFNGDILYKANGRGVDLNVNFDARWGKGEKNVFSSASENFVGKNPFSEPESKALRDFTLKIQPHLTLSYHSKGEEIYYEFFQEVKAKRRDFLIAKEIARQTGYKIKSVKGSVGGYKDWCIDKLKIPSFTIEVGNDNLSHPITIEYLEPIFQKSKGILNALTEKFIWK